MYVNFCLYPYPCGTSIFTHSLTRTHLLQLKIHNIRMKFFWNQKIFRLAIKEISTLRSLYKLFSIKLSADISDSSFVLDSLSKAKTFPNFSASNSFLIFKRFWNVRLSDRCHFIVSFLVWKKPVQLFSIFLFYSIKVSVFEKS